MPLWWRHIVLLLSICLYVGRWKISWFQLPNCKMCLSQTLQVIFSMWRWSLGKEHFKALILMELLPLNNLYYSNKYPLWGIVLPRISLVFSLLYWSAFIFPKLSIYFDTEMLQCSIFCFFSIVHNREHLFAEK